VPTLLPSFFEGFAAAAAAAAVVVVWADLHLHFVLVELDFF
jgi:hypothetical protein